MSTAIVSYSFTGRNNRLAEIVAGELNIEHIKVVETKKRTIMTAAWDVMLGRKPKVEPSPEKIGKYDMVIFFAPVWMGTAAAPIRRHLSQVKKAKKDYVYISLSGGGTETNPGLFDNVVHWAGHKPLAFMDMHVSDLFEKGQLTNDEIFKYAITEDEYKVFAKRALDKIREAVVSE